MLHLSRRRVGAAVVGRCRHAIIIIAVAPSIGGSVVVDGGIVVLQVMNRGGKRRPSAVEES